MAIRLLVVSKTSIITEVSFEVVGDPGHTPDCEGVSFGQGTATAPPAFTAAQIAALVLAKASTIYVEGLAAWGLRQQLASLIA